MMNHHGYGDNFSQKSLSRQQLILSALLESASEMLHIDVLFLWLSYAIVQQFGVQVVQVWVAQASQTGRLSTQLRTIAYEDDTLPQHVTLNNHVAAWAESILVRQSRHSLDNISAIFPIHQAALFGRYGLQFCSNYYLSSSALLPPKSDDLFDEGKLTPLSAAVVLFLYQPLLPEQRMSIRQILKQALKIAEDRGLLLPAAEAPGKLQTNQQEPFELEPLQALAQLIPHHREDVNLMRTSNPLAGSLVIADKQARRLYAAINDSKNLAELRASTHLDLKEFTTALQLLLSQRRIELYDEEGQAVDASLFFKDL